MPTIRHAFPLRRFPQITSRVGYYAQPELTKEHLMRFDDLQLIEPLLRAVRAEGYAEPSPIQAQAIPHVLAGRDLLGCAQTGTGKTAAFALPILQRLAARKTQGTPYLRVLVLAPTREL